MNNQTLVHYGILGMKWGVRRSEAQLARARGSKKSESKKETAKTETKKSKSISEMSDDEIRRSINRLQLEKQYREMIKQPISEAQAKSDRGKKIAADILENSVKNIGSQTVTYIMGTMVNKALSSFVDDPSPINPKKGQKDK